MKHRGIFCLLFALFILALPQVILAGTVTWTGAGDGTSWSDPMNWSGNALPGTTADVTIGTISGNPTIQITAAAGAVQIHSLTSNQPITISNGSLTLASSSKINAILSVTGSASSLNAGPQTTLLADNISVDEGAQVSFPNVTSYAAPTGMSVQWSVQHSGSTLSFPNLTSIAGPTTPNTYLTLLAEYTDQGTGTNTSPEISLPALTTITKADDGDSSPDSGVALTAYSGGLISAPNLTAFNDNDSYPNSSLTASDGGTLSLPKLLAPKGVNINLNALSNPAQFTSLTGVATFEINAGTVVMSNLNAITGIMNITVDQGAQLSFPNVTSYTTPAGLSVQWLAEHSGSMLYLPQSDEHRRTRDPQYVSDPAHGVHRPGHGHERKPAISLPALTAITKADDGDSSANSGVVLNAYSGGLISAAEAQRVQR